MQTKNNLETFKILFIIKGVFNLLLCLFPLFFFSMFSAFDRGPLQQVDNDPPFDVLYFFNAFLIFGILLALAFGILTIIAGLYIGKHKSYVFIIVMTILNCFTGVLGIILGIFTIIELNKPEVRALFYPNKDNFV